MNILFAASEIFPYAKTGGLADVGYALPEALRAQNQKVYTIMPLYNQIDREKYEIVYAGLTFDYWLAGVRHQFDIFHKENNKDELFVYNPILCNRWGLYDDEFGDYGDNALRFGLFSYSVLEVMIRMNLKIDAVHVNDWQTALIPLLMKTRYNLNQKTVLTIHNLAYQGIFPKKVMDELEIDWKSCFKFEGLEYYDNVNFLKAGIFFSDSVTTVSYTYAKEIQTQTFGNTLEGTLKVNSYKLRGILNGISTEVFDPQKDENVKYNYSIKNYKNREKNKLALYEELGLKEIDRPLFVFIGRFTKQKGVDLILDALNLFKSYEANFVILGNGEDFYNHAFGSFVNSFENIHIRLGYDESFARRLYASSDFLLMPSFFEPCGLNQMIIMRYGGLPIVSKTGGLKDTVVDFTDVKELEGFNLGLGITFEELNLFWFNHAVAKALSLYSNKEKFEKISKHNMGVDNSWKNSALEYINLYKS
ncbi:glycogen synthase [Halarcobacter ebronensis]|uniref:Glycogen synthase n=1 Tax=Halarcobacter ebronensis TaxID=1462615 RepID=A0A4Q1APS8_9BACT|nr:glycogen/starch synthase [Halarcobacter ebronensis]QKF83237.1 glycogen synthase [Halarcobacter ebronensis]RXK05128.1 glycogen synthase [Halarcobacter ebronensis]